MTQTVKAARRRAADDPDRDVRTQGVYFGNNLPGVFTTGSWAPRMRTTRGSCVRPGLV